MNLSADSISKTIGLPKKYVWIFWVLIVVITIIIISILYKRIKKLFINEESDYTQLATRFNILLDRWFVNESKVIELASEISDFQKVNTAYRRQYNESLYEKLQDKLNSEEFQQFMNIVDANKDGDGGSLNGEEDILNSNYSRSELHGFAADAWNDFQKSDWDQGKSESWETIKKMTKNDLKALEKVFNDTYKRREGKTFKDYLKDEHFNIFNANFSLLSLNEKLLEKL